MKNTIKVSGFAVVIAAIVFLMAGCVIEEPEDELVTIDIAAIEGVTAPVTGETPVTAITGNSQYTGTVTWQPTVSGTFAADTEYTARISLDVKEGYTFEGVPENFFKVAGATATNQEGSKLISAVFPKTLGPGLTRTPDFTGDIDELDTWLSDQPENTAETAYIVALNVDDDNFADLKAMLIDASDKYVYLDLSGSTITEIPNMAFVDDYLAQTGCDTLTGITLPNSVTTIGMMAFYNCTNFTSITIPASVTSISGVIFYGCTNLTSINVDAGNSAYTAENGIIYNKNKTALVAYPSATDAVIPNSVTSIESAAFYGCTSLTSVTIPNSVTSIGQLAFAYCDNLTSVTLPNNTSFTSIGYSTFTQCTSLTSITIPNSVTTIDDSAFYQCSNLASVTIGNGVTSIGSAAFRECPITSITIPASVTSIGELAFSGCTSLISVTFQGTITSSNLHENAFGTAGLTNYLGDLRAKYLDIEGGVGTYTVDGSKTWTKKED